jgi:hypothetical protein
MSLIDCKDKYIIIYKNKDESREKYYERCNIVRNNLSKGKYSFDELIVLSNIYINMKYLKCVYSDDIILKIKELN